MLQVLCVEGLVPNQRQHPPRCAHHNVRAVVLQCLLILLDGNAAKENRDFDVVKILAEPLVLLVNLKGQFPTQRKGYSLYY